MKLKDFKDNLNYLLELLRKINKDDKRIDVLNDVIINFDDIDKVLLILKEGSKIDKSPILIIDDTYITIFNSLLTEFTKIKDFFDKIKDLKDVKLLSSYDELYEEVLSIPLYDNLPDDIKIKFDIDDIIDKLSILIKNKNIKKLKRIKDKLSSKNINILNKILDDLIKKIKKVETEKFRSYIIDLFFGDEIDIPYKVIEQLYIELQYKIDEEEDDIKIGIEKIAKVIYRMKNDSDLFEYLAEDVEDIIGNIDIIANSSNIDDIKDKLNSYDKDIIYKLYDRIVEENNFDNISRYLIDNIIKNITDKNKFTKFFLILKSNGYESIIKELENIFKIDDISLFLKEQSPEIIKEIRKIFFILSKNKKVSYELKLDLDLVYIYNDGLYYVFDNKKQIKYVKDDKYKEIISSIVKDKKEALRLKQDFSNNFKLIIKQYYTFKDISSDDIILLNKLSQLYYIILNDMKIKDKEITKTINEIILKLNKNKIIIAKLNELNKQFGKYYHIKENDDLTKYLDNFYLKFGIKSK